MLVFVPNMFSALNPRNVKANPNFFFFPLPFLAIAELCKPIMMLIVSLKWFPTKLKRFSTKKKISQVKGLRDTSLY